MAEAEEREAEDHSVEETRGVVLEATQAVVLKKGRPVSAELDGVPSGEIPGRWLHRQGSLRILLQDVAGNLVSALPQVVPTLSLPKGGKILQVQPDGALGGELRAVPFALEPRSQLWEAPNFAVISSAAGQCEAQLQVVFKREGNVKRGDQTLFPVITKMLNLAPFTSVVKTLRMVEPQLLEPQQPLQLVAGEQQVIRIKAFTASAEVVGAYSTAPSSLQATLSSPGLATAELKVEATAEGFKVDLHITNCNQGRPYQLTLKYNEQRQDVRPLMTPQETAAAPSLTIPIQVAAGVRSSLHVSTGAARLLTAHNVEDNSQNVLLPNLRIYWVDSHGNPSHRPSPAGERLLLELRPSEDAPPSPVPPPRLVEGCREVVFQANGEAIAQCVAVEPNSGMHYPAVAQQGHAHLRLLVLSADGHQVHWERQVLFYDTASKHARDRERIRQQHEKDMLQLKQYQDQEKAVADLEATKQHYETQRDLCKTSISDYEAQARKYLDLAIALLPPYHRENPGTADEIHALLQRFSGSWTQYYRQQAAIHHLDRPEQHVLKSIVTGCPKVQGRIVDLIQVQDAHLAHLLSWYLKKPKLTTIVVDDSSAFDIIYDGRPLKQAFILLPLEIADAPHQPQTLPHTKLRNMSAEQRATLQNILRQGQPSFAFQHVSLLAEHVTREAKEKILHYALGNLIIMNDFESAYQYRRTMLNARPRIFCPPILVLKTGEVVSGTVGGENNQLTPIERFLGLNNVLFSPNIGAIQTASQYIHEVKAMEAKANSAQDMEHGWQQHVDAQEQQLGQMRRQLQAMRQQLPPQLQRQLQHQQHQHQNQQQPPANRRLRGR